MQRLVQREHGLDADEVGAAGEQRIGLAPEGVLGGGGVEVAEGEQHLPGRADVAGDEPTFRAHAARGFGRPPVDLFGPFRQAALGELDRAGAEGVGVHDVGPGGEVLPVHLRDRVRTVEGPGLGAHSGRQPGRDQHAAQPAVEDDDGVFQKIGNRHRFSLLYLRS